MAETAVDPHDPQNPDPYASQLIGGLEGAPAVQSIEQPTGQREISKVPRGILIEEPPPDFGAFTDLVPRQRPPIGGIDFGAFSDLVPRGEETSTTETQKALDETPEPGNIDLNNRPTVQNPDGSVSTVRTIGVNQDGKEYVIPTVSDDGRIMSDDEAIQQFKTTGKHFGSFKTVNEANAFAQDLHKQQAMGTWAENVRKNAAHAAVEVGKEFLTGLATPSGIASLVSPFTELPEAYKDAKHAVDVLRGTSSLAEAFPGNQAMKEAEQTPPFSKERFKQGFAMLTQFAMAGAGVKGLSKVGKVEAPAPKEGPLAEGAEPLATETRPAEQTLPAQPPLATESRPSTEGTPEYARVQEEVVAKSDIPYKDKVFARYEALAKQHDQILVDQGIEAADKFMQSQPLLQYNWPDAYEMLQLGKIKLKEGEINASQIAEPESVPVQPLREGVGEETPLRQQGEVADVQPQGAERTGTPEQAAEAPVVPELTDNAGNVRYRKVEGKWRGAKSDVAITDPEIARRLDEDYRKQAEKLPDWAREEMIRRGLKPGRLLNDVDLQNPSVREAIQLDPTLTDAAKAEILRTGSKPEPQVEEVEQAPSGISNERLHKIYGEDAISIGKGRGPKEFQRMAETDTRDPYAVLGKAKQQGIVHPDDVPVLRKEHQRLLNDARAAYGTPQYSELAGRAVDMANAIKSVAHGPASDVMRSLQDVDVPRYESPADFDNIIRERMNREATPVEKETFQKVTDEIRNSNGEAARAATEAQSRLRKSRVTAAKEPMKFDDAAEFIRKQIKELTKDCVV